MKVLIDTTEKTIKNDINYFRVLQKVRCKSCGHQALDADVEKYITEEVGKGYYNAYILMICPICETKDNFEFINKDL